MARERMVTRTIEQATVKMMVVNTKTAQIEYKDMAISATIKPEEVLKYCRKKLPIDGYEYVAVNEYNVTEILYGMSEQKFIEMAEILPPRSGTNEEGE